MMGLVENVSEIEKVTNHCGSSLACDDVCSETGVNAEKYVPKSPWKLLVLEK